MEAKVKYFGYGANRSSEMMEAIIGRKPEGYSAKLRGYELCVQEWEEIPEETREILSNNWGSDFRTYCIRPKEGSLVTGQIWLLTEAERELVNNWEFWYEPIEVQVEGREGTISGIETEMINDPKISQVVEGENYPTFLNKKERMLEVATRVREGYLKEKEKPPTIEVEK
jgi:hypothetical protein